MTVIFNFSPSQTNRAASLMNIGPPVFIKDLEDIILEESNSTFDYELPMITDPDDDPYDIQIALKEAIPFTTVKDQSLLRFDPLKAKNGHYIIGIQIKDKNVIPKLSKYQLRIVVI